MRRPVERRSTLAFQISPRITATTETATILRMHPNAILDLNRGRSAMRNRSIALTMMAWGMSVAAAQDLVINGGFETGSLAPWELSYGGIDLVHSNYWTAYSGVWSIDLSGNEAGGIRQTVTTLAGKKYTIDFALSGNPDGDPAIKRLRVSAGGATEEFQVDIGVMQRPNIEWATRSMCFVAESSATIIEFGSLTPGDFGPVVDEIRVTRAVCHGDANGDEQINFLDLNLVLAYFGYSGPSLFGDVNGDGLVDFMDLNIVLSYFGTTCP